MGDSSRYKARSHYAQPGEIDVSLVESEALRSRRAAEPNLKRPTPAPLSSIPESRRAATRPVAEWERKSLGSEHTTGLASAGACRAKTSCVSPGRQSGFEPREP